MLPRLNIIRRESRRRRLILRWAYTCKSTLKSSLHGLHLCSQLRINFLRYDNRRAGSIWEMETRVLHRASQMRIRLLVYTLSQCVSRRLLRFLYIVRQFTQTYVKPSNTPVPTKKKENESDIRNNVRIQNMPRVK